MVFGFIANVGSVDLSATKGRPAYEFELEVSNSGCIGIGGSIGILENTIHINIVRHLAVFIFFVACSVTAFAQNKIDSLEAELKITDPVFAALQTANRFAVKVGSTSRMFPLSEADFSTFLDVCGKP